MNRARGYTLVELLIAMAVMLVMTGAVMGLLNNALARTPVLEEAADLHQRVRVAVEALAADLRAAGGGSPAGPLGTTLAPAEPRGPGDPPLTARADAVTLRYVPAYAARGRLAEALTPASASVALESSICPQNTVACGFTAGMRALVFNAAGARSILIVESIAAGVLTIGGGPRTVTYEAGTEVVEAVEVSYVLDQRSGELRRSEGGGSFAVADRVEALAVEYFGAAHAALPLAAFVDGPLRGAGAEAFDATLLDVRSVAVTLRLASGSARVPAMTARFAVALRNVP